MPKYKVDVTFSVAAQDDVEAVVLVQNFINRTAQLRKEHNMSYRGIQTDGEIETGTPTN